MVRHTQNQRYQSQLVNPILAIAEHMLKEASANGRLADEYYYGGNGHGKAGGDGASSAHQRGLGGASSASGTSNGEDEESAAGKGSKSGKSKGKKGKNSSSFSCSEDEGGRPVSDLESEIGTGDLERNIN